MGQSGQMDKILQRHRTGGLLLLCALLVFAGSLRETETIEVSSKAGNRNLPICSVDTQEKKVALTFDAAWGNENTQKILDILDKYQIHATFFVTGGWVLTYPEEVKRIAQEGHDLGNHSENHSVMSELSGEECASEIMQVHERVEKLTGIQMDLFRIPYDDYNRETLKEIENCGYMPVQWSVDSADWKNYGAESIVETVLEHGNLDNGAIILCHNGAKYIVQALPELIEQLQGLGYEVVSVSELMGNL